MDTANPQPQDQQYKQEQDNQDRKDKTPAQTVPIIVDLGSRRKKVVEDLKNGRGRLLLEVELAVEQARAVLPESEKNKTLVPVVVLYRQKRRKRRNDNNDYVPFNPLNPFSIFRC